MAMPLKLQFMPSFIDKCNSIRVRLFIPHCQKLPHNKESKSQAQSPTVLLLLDKNDTLSLLNQDPWTLAWDTMDQEAQYEL